MRRAIRLGLCLAMAASVGIGSNANAFNRPVAASPARTTQVQLKVFMSFPRFRAEFEQYFKQFKAKELAQKNVDVSIQLEMPSSDLAGQVLKARLASNDAPDLFTLHAVADVPSFYKAGYLSDLSSQPFVNNLYSNVKRSVTYAGKVVALPLESLEWGYLYNRTLFKQAGIVAPPLTLDAMKADIEKLKAIHATPFELSFQESWIPQLMTALALGGVVTSEQPSWISRMNKGQASYKDVSDIFNIIDLIMQNGTSKPFAVGSAQGSADFANGKAAMWVQGPWQAESILKANPNMQFGVAPLPVSNNPKGTMINLSTSTSLALSPTSKHKDVALDLLNYILDPKDSSALFQTLKFNQVSKTQNFKTYSWIAEALTYVSKGMAYQDLQLPNGVTDEQAKMLESYYSRSVSQSDFIKDLDRTWAQAVKAQGS